MAGEPVVVCIKKTQLVQNGYRDLEHWLEDPDHVYIGRNMEFYVKGAARNAVQIAQTLLNTNKV